MPLAEPETDPPRNVLFVDMGASFGGALVVIGTLIKSLSPSFRPFVVSEVDEEIARNAVGGSAKVIVLRHPINYVLWARISDRLVSVRPRALSRILVWIAAIARLSANAWYALRLFWTMKRERIDIIHLNNGRANLEANLVASLSGLPVVVHEHGIAQHPRRRSSVLRPSTTIAISEVVAESVRDLYEPRSATIVLPNPVHLPDPTPNCRQVFRVANGIPLQAHLVAIVGRIVPWKGQREFLLAAAKVIEVLPESHVAVIGDATDGSDWYLEDLRKLAERLGIADRVHFIGYVARMEEVYCALDVLVHASIEPEPFGMVITEGMLSGVPVIAADSGAPREIVRDGSNGLLVDPCDTAALASAIIRVLTEDGLASRLRRTALADVRRLYDPAAYAKRVEEVYTAVSAGRRVHPDGDGAHR